MTGERIGSGKLVPCTRKVSVNKALETTCDIWTQDETVMLGVDEVATDVFDRFFMITVGFMAEASTLLDCKGYILSYN